MKRLALILLLAAATQAQTSIAVIADCVLPPAHFTTTGTTMPFNNISSGCRFWEVHYTSVGFSVISLAFQSAANTTGNVPDTFGTFGGTTVSGSNPATATTQAQATFKGFYPWLRLNLATATGTGSVRVYAYGYTSTAESTASGN